MIPIRVIALSDEIYTETFNRLVERGFDPTTITKFNAVTGKSLQPRSTDRDLLTVKAINEIHAHDREAHSSLTTMNAVGCYMSHTTLWNEAISSPHGLIIAESDVDPEHGSAPRVFEGIKELLQMEPDADLLYMGYFGIYASEEIDNPNFLKANGRVYGNQFYYISPTGARKYLDYAFPIEVQLDSYMGYMNSLSGNDGFPVLKSYTFRKSLAPQVNDGTTIQGKPINYYEPVVSYQSIKIVAFLVFIFALWYFGFLPQQINFEINKIRRWLYGKKH